MRIRTLTSSLVVAAGFAAAVSSPDTALADTVPFQNLPVAPKMAKTDTPTAPEKVAGGERTDGIFPAILPDKMRKSTEDQGYHYVQIFGSEKEASTFSTDGTLTTNTSKEPSPTRTCLTTGGTLSPHLSLYVRTKPYVPPKPSPQTIAMLQKMHRWPPPPVKVSNTPIKDTVDLIHVERLTQTPDGATLETTEAFIDLNTMGTHQVSRQTTKLVKVATGPNSLGVYAAREEGEKGGTQFLVSNPELPPTASDEDRQAQLTQLTSTANRLVAQMPSGVSSETGCGYVRFTLAAKPGSGQMATVLATAFLPPAADDGEKADDMARFEGEDMSETQLKAVHDMVHRENRSQRARTVAVNLSFSQLSTEANPLLSVTFGWAGKDQDLRF
jgi:hypothetical protein